MGKTYEFIDITENPPTAPALKKIIQQSGHDLRKFFNTSGVQYKELKIKDRVGSMTEPQIISMLAGNGRLLKRPLVTDGSQSSVGFDETTFSKSWK